MVDISVEHVQELEDENLKLPISELKGTLDSAMGSMRKSVHDLHDESVDLKAVKAA